MHMIVITKSLALRDYICAMDLAFFMMNIVLRLTESTDSKFCTFKLMNKTFKLMTEKRILLRILKIYTIMNQSTYSKLINDF